MKNTLKHLSAAILWTITGLAASGQNSWLITGNTNINAATNFLGTTNNRPVVFRTTNVERMRITAAGNVGIGTNAPSYKLHVIGTANGIYGQGSSYGVVGYSSNGYGVYGSSGYLGVYGYGTTYGVYGYSYSGTSAVYGYGYTAPGVYGYSDNNYGGYFYSVNSYGMRAGTTNGFYAGVFDGNVWTSGLYYTSDENLKKNIQGFDNAMSIINKLKPRNYEFKTDEKFGTLSLPKGTHYGLLAQDVEQVLPNIVKETPRELSMPKAKVITPKSNDGAENNTVALESTAETTKVTMNIKAVNYEELIPIMIKAMQEQQKQIEELKNKIASSTATESKTATSTSGVTTNLKMSDAYLKQNAPNPFTKNTSIQVYVPSSAKQAQLIIFSQNGQQLKTYNLNNAGLNQVTIDAATLPGGNYIYSLMVDGRKVDSKNMILGK